MHGSDYAVVSRRVKQAGLLDRRRGYYWAKIPLTLAGYVAGWVLFVVIGDSWYQAITAVVLGVLFTQVAFLGHDAGHRQVFAGRRGNDLLGLVVGDLLLGLSFGWWVDKHTRHHVHPNEEDADPDIGDGVLAFTQRQVLARTSSFGRSFARKQAWLFFPLLTLEALNLHVASVGRCLAAPPVPLPRRRKRPCSRCTSSDTRAGAASAVSGAGVDVRVVQQAVFGLYMGCSFAPNHKGMPTIAPDNEFDYLRRQVLTSRNVRGGRVHRLRAWRIELPDRAPPVPQHAATEPSPCPAAGPRVLRRTQPALRRNQPRRLVRHRASPFTRGRHTTAKRPGVIDNRGASLA